MYQYILISIQGIYVCIAKIFIYIYIKVCDRSRGWREVTIFNSYFTEVYGRALPHSLDCSSLALILTLKSWVLSKAASCILFWVFGMTRTGIEHRSPGPLAVEYINKDRLGAMDDRDEWRERAREIRASSTTWYTHTHIYIYIYIYIVQAQPRYKKPEIQKLCKIFINLGL